MNATTREELRHEADEILKANPEPKQPAAREDRYRGTRPAWNWLAKRNAYGAACLWQVARARQPVAANDNRADAAGMGLDRRPSGKARGPNPKPSPRSIDAYIFVMPGVAPRLGDAEPGPVTLPPIPGTFNVADPPFSEEPRIAVKSQEWIHPDAVFKNSTRFGFCAPEIANGAFFLGADSGLGQPRPNNRGDTRRVDEPEPLRPPSETETVIEVMLWGGNVSDVGEALGAKKGGYAKRRGGKALLVAAEWATLMFADNDSKIKKVAA